jgi:hypothetical protein
MQVNRLAWMRLEGWGRPTDLGLPEIGTLSAQVGNSRLAIRAAAPCFETHRSAIEIVASSFAYRAAMLLSMRPNEGCGQMQ